MSNDDPFEKTFPAYLKRECAREIVRQYRDLILGYFYFGPADGPRTEDSMLRMQAAKGATIVARVCEEWGVSPTDVAGILVEKTKLEDWDDRPAAYSFEAWLRQLQERFPDRELPVNPLDKSCEQS